MLKSLLTGVSRGGCSVIKTTQSIHRTDEQVLGSQAESELTRKSESVLHSTGHV